VISLPVLETTPWLPIGTPKAQKRVPLNRPPPDPDASANKKDQTLQFLLQDFQVPCLTLQPAVFPELFSLAPIKPEPTGDLDPAIIIGDSFEYFRDATCFALQVCAAGFIVPTFKTIWPNKVSARWKLLPTLGSWDQYRTTLTTSMPGICHSHGLTSLSQEKSSSFMSGEAESPEYILNNFLTAVLTALVGTSFGPKSGSNRYEPRTNPKAKPQQQILEALKGERQQFTSESNRLFGAARDFSQIIKTSENAYQEICAEVESAGITSHRLLLRIVSDPDDITADWIIYPALQSPLDPTDVIDEDIIWHPDTPHTFQVRFFQLLSKAGELYPPLREMLTDNRSPGLAIPAEEALLFLDTVASSLEEESITIEAPKWWKRAPKDPNLIITIEAGDDSFSADALAAFDWTVAVGSTRLTSDEFEVLVHRKIPIVRYRGSWVKVNTNEIRRTLERLKKRHPDNQIGPAALLNLAAEEDETTTIQASGWADDLLAALQENAPMTDVTIPETFNGTLRPYQYRGVCWLSYLMEYGFGACLADDMGLGKTIQFIAMMAALPDAFASTLIIAPMSVLGNWKREIERFLPGTTVCLHHGTARAKGEVFDRAVDTHQVVLTTYHLIQRDADLFANRGWDCIVLDEAQNIKNHRTKQSKAVHALKGRQRIALTGTPVENRLQELWSIMSFLNPGYLGTFAEFQEDFGDASQDQKQMSRLRRLIRPFVLRRVKTDTSIINDLPEKMEMKIWCSLTEEQASLYAACVDDMMASIEETSGIKRKGRVLRALTALKQICDHPSLYQKDGKKIPGRSGKVDRLMDMLEEVLENNEKALIFSQYATFAKMLAEYFTNTLSVPVFLLHGGTPRNKREKMIQAFTATNGPGIFLLSLKAGGLGLNLTAATHVFHIDRWWNPAVESQATDRAFRIGQDKNVQVHLMIAAGTLEERIDTMLEEKRGLAEMVLTTGDSWLTELSGADLREVLTLRGGGD